MIGSFFSDALAALNLIRASRRADASPSLLRARRHVRRQKAPLARPVETLQRPGRLVLAMIGPTPGTAISWRASRSQNRAIARCECC
jgi:hypothetical protein